MIDYVWIYDPQSLALLGKHYMQPDPVNGGYFDPPSNTLPQAPSAAPAENMTCYARDGAWVWEANPELEKPAEPTRKERETAAFQAIDAWASTEKSAGFMWNKHKFQSDQEARDALLTCHAAGIGTKFGYWRSADNVNVPDGSAGMVASLVTAMLARGEEIFARKQAMKAVIPTLTDEQLAQFHPGW